MKLLYGHYNCNIVDTVSLYPMFNPTLSLNENMSICYACKPRKCLTPIENDDKTTSRITVE